MSTLHDILPFMHNTKKDNTLLRTLIRKKRLALSKQSQAQKSERIVSHIYGSTIFRKSKDIAFYHAVQGEADPSQLVIKDNNNKQFYLPTLSDNSDQGLLFSPVNKDTQFKNNRFSIPEPICNKSNLVTGENLDLVLMPLLCFDKQANRLGMGGGFYDRSFAFKKGRNIKPILVGFAYDFQEVEELVAESWDVPLDFIVTESGLIEFD